MTVMPMKKETPSQEEALRRRAVAARDPAADGAFVYAVRTTGVYCRPSCPARPARPENLAFFEGPDEAEASGFRACLRCRPREEKGARGKAAVEAACRLIDASEEIPSLAQMAAEAGLSPHHFHRLFKSATGVTPRAFAAERRAERLRAALGSGAPVTAAIHDAGYGAQSRFYAEAQSRLGMAPSTWRKGGEGETIRYAIAPCTLGLILVGATQKGVCAIFLADDRVTLAGALKARFPKAALIGADDALGGLVQAVLSQVERPRQDVGLALDIQGTAFQQRVWAALREIPLGETETYSAVAARIGAPAAVRAVAGACGANPVAILIPCHRVIGKDGSLTGYRWGTERKKALLDKERAS
jgi:AraC family transcriptional regulator of adaptative response/methylated-DNA-[protein]-cysteine methyltransferase